MSGEVRALRLNVRAARAAAIVREHVMREGVPPSVAEVSRALHCGQSTACKYLRRAVSLGMLRGPEGRQARGYRPVPQDMP